MSWRYGFSSRAKAEDLIQQDLGEAGFSKGLTTNVGFQFTKQEILKFRVHGTTVDGLWNHFNLVTFYDGPHHLKDRQQWKDEQIDKVLLARGFTVLRFPYQPPISKQRRKQIIETLKNILIEKGYLEWRVRATQ